MIAGKLGRLITISLIVVGVSFAQVYGSPSSTGAMSGLDKNQLKVFSHVIKRVHELYVKDISDEKLIQGAINGMLQSLDPHSSYLTPDQFKELQVETKGEFGGLGIEITLDNGILTIVSPIEDTPAYRAGLKAGDKIVQIEGKSTKNITLLQAVNQMRGRPGTKIEITVMRQGFRKPKDFTIVRDIIRVKSVKNELVEEGYPYVRITHFNEKTIVDLKKAMEKYGGDKSIKGLIVDLRNNPGGLLEQAVAVSRLFLDHGLIVYTDGRVKDQRMKLRAEDGSGPHYHCKLAILINQGSASASEIVAGAMQDHDRALVFGTKSFGKASVQTIMPLGNNYGLRLTTAYYYTPRGRHIEKSGIVPDVNLKDEIEKQEDELIKEEEQKQKDKKKKSRFEKRKVDPDKDIAVKRALEWLQSDVSVKEYKMEHDQSSIPDTAWILNK